MSNNAYKTQIRRVTLAVLHRCWPAGVAHILEAATDAEREELGHLYNAVKSMERCGIVKRLDDRAARPPLYVPGRVVREDGSIGEELLLTRNAGALQLIPAPQASAPEP